MESLRGCRGIRHDADSHPDPTSPRDAKSRLEGQILSERSYSETADQPALSLRFDMRPAYQNCRLFGHLVKVFGELAPKCGLELLDWPPPNWHEAEV